MKKRIDTIEDMLAIAAGRYVSKEEAGDFARLCVETHLRKAPRMNPLQEAVNDIQAWDTAFKSGRNAGPVIIKDKPGMVLYDFNGLPPSLKIKQIQDRLEKKARENGIAAAGIFNSGGIITLNMWAEGLAQKDLVGIAVLNGGTDCCVPFGAKRGVLGTNPLAYAVPTTSGPMLLDMATTQIPFFDVKNAKANKTPLPEGSALDGQGRPTTDAVEALDDNGVANLLPMGGGFKGYGIMMLIEVLTGSLVGSLLSTQQTSGWNPHEYGCFITAIDISSFTDLDIFKKGVGQMCESIRNMDPAREDRPVSIPGDRGNACMKDARQKGEIHVAPEILEVLTLLAEKSAGNEP